MGPRHREYKVKDPRAYSSESLPAAFCQVWPIPAYEIAEEIERVGTEILTRRVYP